MNRRVGFSTQSLLEQWRDSYSNGDYDDDPYDDDMYEGQDLSQELHAICDNLDIQVRESPAYPKKWHPDENLLKEDVSTIPVWVKIHGVPVTAFSEDGLSAILQLNCVGDKKTLKKPSQTSLANNKKKGVEPTIKVSNSNPFDVLNLVDNDVMFGTNQGITNLVNNRATSSGSSFMNAGNSSSGTTHIIDKIRKFKELLTSGKVILVDKAGNPLKKVEFLGEYDSEDEVALVDNDMDRSLASGRVGFSTQSLLEQWRDLYSNGDYDDDPYDDDMYEGQDLSQELHAICDNLDIQVRGRKKK
nr:hypothetical protein [Tanacetum cinerariifolium]